MSAKQNLKKPAHIAISGGATNIGKAISTKYLEDGCRVAVGQPDTSVTEPLVERYGDQVVSLELHQEEPESCEAFIRGAISEMGGLDLLVNNAAVVGSGSNRRFLNLDPAYVDWVVDVNLKGVIHCSLHAAKQMKEQDGGTIIHITSINAFRPQNMASIYAATKGGLAVLTQSMAKELAPYGIRVAAVAPGDIRTDTYEELIKEQEEEGVKNEIIGQTPLGQGQPEDIAGAVYYLASPEAKFITGTTLLVDGGLLA